MSFLKEFDHLRISLQDIKSATNNFGDSNCIGRGGFGKVYKGELILSEEEQTTMVAVKCLDRALGQGAPEFWKEIMMLSRYRHENLISLLGFCDESGENILVYEYLSNKSLDLYLSSTHLSWTQRLKICIGAARGLEYLHDAGGTEHRVLHRDIKSSNILLDVNWKARISDFGLSKIGPANQEFTYLVSNVAGTYGYCDPLYMETGFLTKESDVYSFGVVLFEVLCGRLCMANYDDVRRFLPKLAQNCYEEKKLHTIIHTSLREQMAPHSIDRFSAIAYQCLRRDRQERPSVAEIMNELENALDYQVAYEFEKEKKLKSHVGLELDSEEYWDVKLPPDSEEIIKTLSPLAVYATKKELFSLLHEGILFHKCKRFFWINNDGKKCESISVTEFLDQHQSKGLTLEFPCSLRFSEVVDIRCQIRSSMLSLGVMYAASLVFKFCTQPIEDFIHPTYVEIKWKSKELNVTSAHFAEWTNYRWLKIRMWHFINNNKCSAFEIVIEKISAIATFDTSGIFIQGIKFEPIEEMGHEEIEGTE